MAGLARKASGRAGENGRGDGFPDPAELDLPDPAKLEDDLPDPIELDDARFGAVLEEVARNYPDALNLLAGLASAGRATNP